MFIPGFTGSGPPMPQAMLPESSFLREAHTAGHPSYPQGFGRSLDAVGAARVEGPAAEPNEPNTYISGCVPPSPPPTPRADPGPRRAATTPRRPKRRRANLGRPFFRPRPASDDDGSFASPRTRLSLGSTSSARDPVRAPRGGAGTNGGPARSRLGVLALVLLSPPPRGGAPLTDAFFDPFSLSLSPKKSFEHLLNAAPRRAFGRPPRALTP